MEGVSDYWTGDDDDDVVGWLVELVGWLARGGGLGVVGLSIELRHIKEKRRSLSIVRSSSVLPLLEQFSTSTAPFY